MSDTSTTPPREPAPLPSASKPREHRPSKRAKPGTLLVLPSARYGEGRRLREFRAGLIEHVGGKPSPVQLALIDRATVLQSHLSAMDRQASAGDGVMSEHASRQYLAWSNSLTRTLRQLGLKGAPPRQPTLQEILARTAAEPPSVA